MAMTMKAASRFDYQSVRVMLTMLDSIADPTSTAEDVAYFLSVLEMFLRALTKQRHPPCCRFSSRDNGTGWRPFHRRRNSLKGA